MDRVGKLFAGGATTARVARWFLFHPEASAGAATLRDKTKSTIEQARVALRTLESAGIVRKRASGRYALNKEFPHAAPLKELLIGELLAVVNLPARLRSAVGTIKLLCAAGFFIGNSESRTDLLIVGDKLNQTKLQKAITAIEAELGTDIRYTGLSAQEFNYRAGFNDKLIRDILDYPHEKVVNKIAGL